MGKCSSLRSILRFEAPQEIRNTDILAPSPVSSLINVSQQIPRWKKFLPEVDETANLNSESWLGLLVNMMNIGSIVSFFIT